MGVKGLWLGFCIACILLDLGFSLIIICPNWEKIAIEMKIAIESGREIKSPGIDNARKYYFTPKSSIHDISQNSYYH